jgi:hypothetical protein
VKPQDARNVLAQRHATVFLQHLYGVAQEAVDCAASLRRAGFNCDRGDLVPLKKLTWATPGYEHGFALGKMLVHGSSSKGWRVVMIGHEAALLAFGKPAPVNSVVRVSIEGGPVLLELR